MARTFRLNLADIPWPASVLECNHLLAAMQTSDVMDLVMNDGDVFKNLVLLLGALPDTELTARHAGGGYEIRLIKTACP